MSRTSPLPDMAIIEVRDIDCRIEPHDWRFMDDEATRIDAHWRSQRAVNPRLFDGRVLLSHRLAVENDWLRGACFETAYRAFLSWRDFGFPGKPVFNCFAMPALLSADGAFMLGEMSPGTANAGRLYFPAGTPEPSDAGPDGRVDFTANILRELEEETGLAPNEVTLDTGWSIVVHGPLVACMRVAQSPLDCATLQARLARFNEGQQDPELTRFVPVRGASDLDETHMPPFMLLYLRHALGSG